MHVESTQAPTRWQLASETRLAAWEVSVVEPFLDAANFGHHLSIGILQCYNYPPLLYFSKKKKILNEVRVDTYWQSKPSLKLDCGRKIQNYVHIDKYYWKPELITSDNLTIDQHNSF